MNTTNDPSVRRRRVHHVQRRPPQRRLARHPPPAHGRLDVQQRGEAHRRRAEAPAVPIFLTAAITTATSSTGHVPERASKTRRQRSSATASQKVVDGAEQPSRGRTSSWTRLRRRSSEDRRRPARRPPPRHLHRRLRRAPRQTTFGARSKEVPRDDRNYHPLRRLPPVAEDVRSALLLVEVRQELATSR